MFYVSRVDRADNNAIVYVTDTSDGITEGYSIVKIKELVVNNLVDIYGVSVDAGIISVREVKLNQKLVYIKLVSLLNNWRKDNSCKSRNLLDVYLVSAKVGTSICAVYVPDSNEISCKVNLTKSDYDVWVCDVPVSFGFTSPAISSRAVSKVLKSICTGAKLKSLVVKG